MSYIVTARKWRPQVADDVVGQSHVTTTLRNALASNRLSHAYLFSGPRGVGKTTTARILAKAVNCLHPKDYEPDNTCDLCVEITEGRSVNVFEIDGASNRGVDEIRNLRDSVRYPPAKGAYKVYIIDEVHMLTKEAFNALLKTLEEPPPYVIFIFATTEIHKVPATILSRCQRFDFRRLSLQEIAGRLRYIAEQEGITISDNALAVIAKRGDGSLRDAQSIFDQIVSFCGDTITEEKIIGMLNIVEEEIFFRVTDLVIQKDTQGGLALIDEIVNRGVDPREFLNGLIEHLRNFLIVVTMKSTNLLEVSDHTKARYQEASGAFTAPDLLRLIKLVTDTEASIKWSQHPRFKLEICITQMIAMDRTVEISTLIGQIEELKKALNGDASGSRPQGPAAQVRGTVKASQPTLLPEQRVPPPPPASPKKSDLGEKEPPPAQTMRKQAEPVLTNDEARGKWADLIAEACRQRIAFGSMLSETSLVSVEGDKLRIACPDGFHVDALKRNKQFLMDLAQSVYGAKLRLDTLIGAASPQLPEQETSLSANPASTDRPAQPPAEHPILQSLIREFGAQEIG